MGAKNKLPLRSPNGPCCGMEYSHNWGLRDIGYDNIPMTRDAKLRLFVNIPLVTLSTRIFTWPGVR
jgi:hypothetical protein